LFLLLLLALPLLKLTFHALSELLALAEADQKFDAITHTLDGSRCEPQQGTGIGHPAPPHPQGSDG